MKKVKNEESRREGIMEFLLKLLHKRFGIRKPWEA